LVPWDGEMLSLLSLNRTKVSESPAFGAAVQGGIFTTIYQEPVVALRRHLPPVKQPLLPRAPATRSLFSGRRKKKRKSGSTTQPFAVYASGALLAAGRGSRLLASLEYDAAEAQWPLMIGDKAAAAINNPARAESLGPNPRSVTLLRKLSQEEEDAVLALAIMFAIRG
jgi:hypothetical protein